MKIKPSKCRSFTISRGKPNIVHYDIEGYKVPSISEEDQKFLGRLLFFEGKSQQTFDHLEKSIKEKLENLEKTSIRSEYKLEIYQMYILPSIRFLLTVHDLPPTHLSTLDTAADQYLKRWAGLPRCATNEILHLRTAMNIKKISTLYTETHCVSHAATRLKVDDRVNMVLDCKIIRESQYTRKHSVTIQAEEIFQSARNMNTVAGEIPGTTPENIRVTVPGEEGEETTLILPGEGENMPPPHQFLNDVKNHVKTQVLMEDNEASLTHIKDLFKQGRFLELTQMEQTDATWKSYLYNLPKGTMKFVLNASIDNLPTKANLIQWGKRTNDKCRCGIKETLNHVLNCCALSFFTGRKIHLQTRWCPQVHSILPRHRKIHLLCRYSWAPAPCWGDTATGCSCYLAQA